jgi:hypothetical protein
MTSLLAVWERAGAMEKSGLIFAGKALICYRTLVKTVAGARHTRGFSLLIAPAPAWWCGRVMSI